MAKGNQLFQDFVKRQKELNNFEELDIEATIEKIYENPTEFGKEYAELYLSRNFKRILEAKRIGMDFARKNLSL